MTRIIAAKRGCVRGRSSPWKSVLVGMSRGRGGICRYCATQHVPKNAGKGNRGAAADTTASLPQYPMFARAMIYVLLHSPSAVIRRRFCCFLRKTKSIMQKLYDTCHFLHDNNAGTSLCCIKTTKRIFSCFLLPMQQYEVVTACVAHCRFHIELLLSIPNCNKREGFVAKALNIR